MLKIKGRWLWLMAMLLLWGCDGPGGQSAGSLQLMRESLLDTDRAFSDVSAEQGIAAAYDRYLADDAVQLQDGGAAIYGKAAIMENIRAVVDMAELSLRWEPMDAAVSASGDLGYTWGNYVLEGRDEYGELYVVEGKYANFWRGASNGSWQVMLDISNQDELPLIAADDWGFSDQPGTRDESLSN